MKLAWASCHEASPDHAELCSRKVVVEKKEWNLISARKSQKKLKSSHIMFELVGAGARCDVVDEASLGVMS
jgi:hypothetical protein